MTHIICMTYGGKEDVDRLVDAIQKNCIYTIKEGYDTGNKAQVKFRELKFYSISVKSAVRDEFLGEIRSHARMGSEFDHERPHKAHTTDETNILHGADGRGFPIGRLRGFLRIIFKLFNCKPLDITKIPEKKNVALQEEFDRQPWKAQIMIFAELPDGFESSGREWS